MVKILCSVVFLLGLAVAATNVTGAYTPFLPDPAPSPGDPIPKSVPDASELGEAEEEDIIIAIVKSIDPIHGLIHLDSEIGQLLTFATPEALQDLHAGDLVVVRVIVEEVEENNSQEAVTI